MKAIGVKRHQRHHQRRGGVAAEEAVALDEHHACTRVGGRDGGTQARGPAADHQHIGFAGEQRLSWRQLQPDGSVRPL